VPFVFHSLFAVESYFKEIKMSNKLCLVLSVLFAATMLLVACTAAMPTAAPAAPVQPTTAPAATAAPVQPTTAPGEIPQSGDLCGGTGGNGQIVSVGNNEFTMKRNDDGSDQVVHLTGQATIKTSAGSASLSDLKIGYRVTLVGGPNPDGSFTADTVVVCNGSQ
jgi:pectate lyase